MNYYVPCNRATAFVLPFCFYFVTFVAVLVSPLGTLCAINSNTVVLTLRRKHIPPRATQFARECPLYSLSGLRLWEALRTGYDTLKMEMKWFRDSPNLRRWKAWEGLLGTSFIYSLTSSLLRCSYYVACGILFVRFEKRRVRSSLCTPRIIAFPFPLFSPCLSLSLPHNSLHQTS